jgi:hypothetical protein
VLTLGAQTVMSKKVSHSLNPIWRETLMLSWDKLDALVIKVLHIGRFRKQGKAEVLCSAKVDLKEVLLGGGTGDGDGGMVMETVALRRVCEQRRKKSLQASLKEMALHKSFRRADSSGRLSGDGGVPAGLDEQLSRAYSYDEAEGEEEEQEELLGAAVSSVDSPEQGTGLRPTVASSRTPQRTPSSRKQLAFPLGGTPTMDPAAGAPETMETGTLLLQLVFQPITA